MCIRDRRLRRQPTSSRSPGPPAEISRGLSRRSTLVDRTMGAGLTCAHRFVGGALTTGRRSRGGGRQLMEERIIDTLIGVSIAVVGSAIIFIGANKWFDLTSTRWKWFGAVTGAVIAGVSSAILLGNRIIAWKTGPDADATDLSLLLVPLYMALAGVVGYLLNATDDRNRRLLIGGVGGLVVAGSLGTVSYT